MTIRSVLSEDCSGYRTERVRVVRKQRDREMAKSKMGQPGQGSGEAPGHGDQGDRNIEGFLRMT